MKATSACQFHTIELTYISTSNSSGTLIHFYFLQVIATLKGHTKKVTNVVYHPHEVFSLSSGTFLSRGWSLFGLNIFSGWFCYIILFDLKSLNHRQMLHDHTFNYLNLIMFFFPLDNFLLLTTCMTVHVNMVLKDQTLNFFGKVITLMFWTIKFTINFCYDFQQDLGFSASADATIRVWSIPQASCSHVVKVRIMRKHWT